MCTTLVFVWPLLAALAALLPLGESLRGNRPRAWQCAAALPLTLYAANMELLAGLLDVYKRQHLFRWNRGLLIFEMLLPYYKKGREAVK